MAKDHRRRRAWLESHRRIWLTTGLALPLVAALAFAAEAGSVSETYFGMTVAVWLLGIIPLLGFTTVRPVSKSKAVDRLASLAVKTLCGIPAVIGVLVFLFFLGSISPGGLGWDVQLGHDFAAHAPAMLPPAAGSVYGSLLIARQRARQPEIRAIYVAFLVVGAATFLTLVAFFTGLAGVMIVMATPAVVVALAAFGFTVYRLYEPATQAEANEPDEEEDDAGLASDPWHALRRS